MLFPEVKKVDLKHYGMKEMNNNNYIKVGTSNNSIYIRFKN